ncbi:unnamed protein product [Lactuca virosa]|uniref:Uncharacterized protein n=1 Tax=Lactuca virosa TaxID=75947 RepID=A0AAU9M0R7_9ASTR|nr:unnamed protein product [Lactuca virosa]
MDSCGSHHLLDIEKLGKKYSRIDDRGNGEKTSIADLHEQGFSEWCRDCRMPHQQNGRKKLDRRREGEEEGWSAE